MAYSENKNFNAMQEEAIRRVREMQKRSRSIVGNPHEASPSEGDSHEKEQDQSQHNNRSGSVSASNNHSSINSILGSLLGGGKNGELFSVNGIKIDEEKAMIGLLIYILYKQGADVKLLLGLGYLLL